MSLILSYLVWDPSPGMFSFNLPLLHRPLLWYGFFFALGFFLAYGILLHLLRRYFQLLPQFRKEDVRLIASKFAEQLTFYVVLGALIGARVGDVLFYQNLAEIVKDPLSIIAIWEGGLASHGGAMGILIALWLFSRRQKIPFLRALDFTVVPTALAAVFIRIGNFFNQEILGTPTTLPWGVIFLHPVDRGPIVPRHPAQLYEAAAYFLIFISLFCYARAHPLYKKEGKVTGLFLVLVFGFRFAIEWVKVEQSAWIASGGFLTMGQWLSIPFILLGAYLLVRKKQ